MPYLTKLGVWTLLGLATLIFAPKIFDKFDSGKEFSFSFETLENIQGAVFAPVRQTNDQTLEAKIRQVLEGEDGEFAVVVEELGRDDGIFVGINHTKIYPAASLYKLFLLSAALLQVEKGQLSDTEVIESSQKHLEEVLGFEEFGYEDYSSDKISHQLGSVLSRIATISDNYASIMLAEKIGWEAVRASAKELGANSTSIKSPISTTASDIALFFKRLYKGEVVSKTSSDKIIELLSASKLNSRIPSKLPKDLKIAHKTGELPQVRHDSGIVFLEGRPYTIVLMSKDLKGEDSGVEVLATISKVVYDYFSNKGNE